MRKIKHSPNFKRDYKNLTERVGKELLTRLLESVVVPLSQDIPLDPRFHDHKLKGKLSGFRECHIRPDLLLIYEKTDDGRLVLHRLGSHSKLRLVG
ncbi:MAG: type II toxin-antitoxin system YafQ family toxin [Candidatus Symbiobacter sp.]|nr:type II toxin-antitoxin system YafQ family toxin [Candidatus Symbiobacter sp.]